MPTSSGLTHDRSFMVVDQHGAFRSQRRDPRLAVDPPDGMQLTLRAPGAHLVRVKVDLAAARRLLPR